MVFPHHSSGYRDDRGRGQAKAFETPSPTGGFLAPGVPVEVAPPPPPPPVHAPMAPAAGAAATGGALLFGTVAAIAAGAYLGVEIKKDIDKFKKKAKRPFYDDLAWIESKPWDGSVPYEWADYYADLQFQQQTQRTIDEYYAIHTGAQDGWEYIGPGSIVETCFETCVTTGPSLGWALREGTGTTPGTWKDGACGQCAPYAGFEDPLSLHFETSPAALVDHWSDLGHFPIEYIGDFYTLDLPGYEDRCKANRVLRILTSTANAADPANWTAPHAGTVIELSPQADAYTLGWGEAVAPPGTQPSLAEQLARQNTLPGSRADLGYFIQVPINYPFVLVDVAPGSPPVSVPDVTIDPGPGTIVITPPSPPEYPSPEAGEFEKKPYNPMPGFINVATEAQDFLEAMHKGLPKKHRSKGRWGVVPDGDIILRDIIDHWDEWDAQVALEAFVNNQIEDHLLGKYYFGKMPNRVTRNVGGKVAGKIPLPEVHFANGQHSIEIGDVEIELVPGR